MPGVAIVLGSSRAALDELSAAFELCPGAPVICVNDSLRTCPVKAHAFATLHHEKARRFLRGLDIDGLPLFTMEQPARDEFQWTIVREKWAGTSGLYAVQIALNQLGFAGVIVAGVPIDHTHGTAYPLHRGQPWAGGYHDRYRRAWAKAALPFIRDRVRSMSGFTRELLGAPDADWLNNLSVNPLNR